MQTQHSTFARLATASMVTGYTLSNAELRLKMDRQFYNQPVSSSPSMPQLSSAVLSQLPIEATAHIAALEARLAEQQQQLHSPYMDCMVRPLTCTHQSFIVPPFPRLEQFIPSDFV